MTPSRTHPDVAKVQRISAIPNILQVVAETTGVGLALVARVTETEWTACAVLDRINFGLKTGDPLELSTTLCREVRDSKAPIIIDHASVDAQYCDHPTPKLYKFESYISVPIFTRDGEYFGNLCALDPQPRNLSDPKFVTTIKLFAELVGAQLSDEALLRDAEQTAELREQFIAALGHDLRNPLSSISMGAQTLLRRGALPDQEMKVAHRIRASVTRMSRLVDALLDFARGRMGSGMKVSLAPVVDLETDLRHVVAELEAAHPDRKIHFQAEPVGDVHCDRDRVAQVLSNLLANALEHGPEDSAVHVSVRSTRSAFILSVSNTGEPMSQQTLERIFKPYQRGPASKSAGGLGLGLYIVSEIARAHGGTVECTSTAQDGTTFTLTLPRQCAPAESAAATNAG